MTFGDGKRYGKLGKPLQNVLMVGRKRAETNNMLDSWAWLALVDDQDGTFSCHWFTTYRGMSDRLPTDHFVGDGVDISKNKKNSNPDDFEYDLSAKGYTEVFTPGWPCQVAPSADVADDDTDEETLVALRGHLVEVHRTCRGAATALIGPSMGN